MVNSLRFVIQKHTREGMSHWDLMLERDNSLETFRLELPPEKLAQQQSTAVKIFDHPLKFLTYKGPINKGKGSVEISEAGTYRIIGKTENEMLLQFDGKILKGRFTLRLIEDDKWQFSLAAGPTTYS